MNRLSMYNLNHIRRTFKSLERISRQLHRLDENACNYGPTERQERRVADLMREAERLAQDVGYHAYHQSDPRGASLYLIDDTMNDTNYSNGICI